MDAENRPHNGFRRVAILVGVLATVVTAMAVMLRRHSGRPVGPELGGWEEELGI